MATRPSPRRARPAKTSKRPDPGRKTVPFKDESVGARARREQPVKSVVPRRKDTTKRVAPSPATKPDVDESKLAPTRPDEVFDDEMAMTFVCDIERLALVKACLSKLKKEEDEIVGRIKTTCDGLDATRFEGDGLIPITYSFGKSSNLSVERLLSRGVDPDIIKDCTVVTESPRVNVDWKGYLAVPEDVVDDAIAGIIVGKKEEGEK